MAKVQAKLDEMQAQFDAAMAQKQALEEDAAMTQKKMDSATALLHALAGTQAKKWQECLRPGLCMSLSFCCIFERHNHLSTQPHAHLPASTLGPQARSPAGPRSPRSLTRRFSA